MKVSLRKTHALAIIFSFPETQCVTPAKIIVLVSRSPLTIPTIYD